MLLDIEQSIANLENCYQPRQDWILNHDDELNEKEMQPLLKRADSSSSLETTPKKRYFLRFINNTRMEYLVCEILN